MTPQFNVRLVGDIIIIAEDVDFLNKIVVYSTWTYLNVRSLRCIYVLFSILLYVLLPVGKFAL